MPRIRVPQDQRGTLPSPAGLGAIQSNRSPVYPHPRGVSVKANSASSHVIGLAIFGASSGSSLGKITHEFKHFSPCGRSVEVFVLILVMRASEKSFSRLNQRFELMDKRAGRSSYPCSHLTLNLGATIRTARDAGGCHRQHRICIQRRIQTENKIQRRALRARLGPGWDERRAADCPPYPSLFQRTAITRNAIHSFMADAPARTAPARRIQLTRRTMRICFSTCSALEKYSAGSFLERIHSA